VAFLPFGDGDASFVATRWFCHGQVGPEKERFVATAAGLIVVPEGGGDYVCGHLLFFRKKAEEQFAELREGDAVAAT